MCPLSSHTFLRVLKTTICHFIIGQDFRSNPVLSQLQSTLIIIDNEFKTIIDVHVKQTSFLSLSIFLKISSQFLRISNESGFAFR